MKKLLMGLTLLASMSSFANTNNSKFDGIYEGTVENTGVPCYLTVKTNDGLLTVNYKVEVDAPEVQVVAEEHQITMQLDDLVDVSKMGNYSHYSYEKNREVTRRLFKADRLIISTTDDHLRSVSIRYLHARKKRFTDNLDHRAVIIKTNGRKYRQGFSDSYSCWRIKRNN